MPASLKLKEEYGDALNVLFVEVQGADANKVERFAFDKEWMGTGAAWTTERPFRVGDVKGIPHFALLDPDGTIVLQGYSTRMKSEIEEKVAELVDVAENGPESLPRSLRKAWKAFAKGDLAKGIAEAEEVAADGDDDAAYATDLAAEFRARAGRQLDRAAWLIDNGKVLAAEELVEELVDGLDGEAELLARAEALEERLESDELEAEFDAAKVLAKAEAALYEDGLGARGVDRRLERIVDKYPGTKSAERARHLLDLVRGS